LEFVDPDILSLSERRSTLVQSWLARWSRLRRAISKRWRVKAGLAGGFLPASSPAEYVQGAAWRLPGL
jgi:hypothetical protein